jgi:hypothetical protein
MILHQQKATNACRTSYNIAAHRNIIAPLLLGHVVNIDPGGFCIATDHRELMR